MVPVYFISGLAADERVFRHISLPKNCKAVYLPWIQPFKAESLSSYASRLAAYINTTEKFYLIGLSFGGMIATEISNRFKVEKTILISSIPSSEQLPTSYKLAGTLRLHRVMPISIIKHASWLKRFFTTETQEDKVMLKGMIKDSDTQFIRWALHAVLTWKNNKVPHNFFHVHGTNDQILPSRYTRPTHFIEKGGHLMVMNRSEEINEILASILTGHS